MKIGVVSLGCDKNRVDSEKMIARLVQAGHTVVSSEEEADVIIVNTCAFTEEAKAEAIDEILSAAEAKKRGGKKLIVTGCLPERYMDSLEEELDSRMFFRASRHCIINISAIVSIQRFSNGRLRIITNPPSETDILVSQARREDFLSWIEGCPQV